MLMPLGLLSQSRGNGAAGSFELITTVSGTGASGIIDLTSISATYTHLQIRFAAKNTSSQSDINVTFNNDSSSTYYWHNLYGNGSSGVAGFGGNTYLRLSESVMATTTADAVSVGIIDILDYGNTNKNKTLRAFYGLRDGAGRIYQASGYWPSTSAITSVKLTASAGNFASISRFSLYGSKGS